MSRLSLLSRVPSARSVGNGGEGSEIRVLSSRNRQLRETHVPGALEPLLRINLGVKGIGFARAGSDAIMQGILRGHKLVGLGFVGGGEQRMSFRLVCNDGPVQWRLELDRQLDFQPLSSERKFRVVYTGETGTLGGLFLSDDVAALIEVVN